MNPLSPYRFAYLAVVCLLLHTGSFAQAPTLRFKHMGSEQGLSNSTVETIYQDSRGFVWFGTRDGLNRYDGYQVAVYRYSATDSNSLSDNYIRCIYEDRQHVLWIATINGLNRFNVAGNNFSRYRHQPANDNSLSHNMVTSIGEDSKGRLWIGTFGGGLNVLDRVTGNFRHWRHNAAQPGSLSSDWVNGITTDSSGRLWVGTETGLNLFQEEKQGFRLLKNTTDSTPEHNVIRTMCCDRQGQLWLGTEEKGLLLFSPATGSFTAYAHQEKDPSSLSGNQVRALLADSKGRLWVGGVNGGLDLFQSTTHTFYHYQNEPENSWSLSQRTVSAIFEDRQGNLWVGTHRGGINIYTPGAEKFRLYQQQPSANSLSYNDVKAFCEDSRGNIWIGTDGGGLNLFDRVHQTFRHFKYDAYQPSAIGSNEILSITEDQQGDLWIGTWGGGLNRYHPGSGAFTRLTHRPGDAGSISSNYVQKVLEDSKGRLWVATYYGGLQLYDRATGKFTRVAGEAGTAQAISGNNVVSLAEDRQGHIWIGTDDGGLNCYTPATGQVAHYFTGDEKMPDLRVLFIDSKGRLWVGQTGLYLFDPVKNSFSLYTIQAGLASEFIKGIAEDAQGYFWIATSNGITRFRPSTQQYKKYNTGDGLQGLEFEANAYLQTRDGQLYFGGINGFNAFYPSDITASHFLPPVYLTDFQLFNQKVVPAVDDSPLQQDISVTQSITLRYNQSSFSFGFAALDYTASQNNQYAYKLDGWDRGWNYVGSERKASYTNLDPGTYVFRVKASNNDGVWNEVGTAVTIHITPPFWKTWWFMLLVFAAVFYILYSVLAFRRRSELKKIGEKKREEVHQLKLQFFTNISHEFRTPLTLIVGPLEKMIRESAGSSYLHYYKLMQKNAYRLLNLVNELMDFRKVETGMLQLKVMPGNPVSFLHEVASDFEEWAAEKDIRFTIKDTVYTGDVWFDNQVLEKIIFNLLNNAFKYTSAGGEVILELLPSLQVFKPAFPHELVLPHEHKAIQYLHIRIADNGIGITAESLSHLFERYFRVNENHLGSGIGLAFVRSLTFLHKGSIRVYSQRDKGTEVIVSLPVSKEDYTTEEQWLGEPAHKARQLESLVSNHQYQFAAPLDNVAVKNDTGPQLPLLLIVDDNSELRAFLKEALAADYRIAEASDGQMGFEKAKEVLPDIIISDVMMPVMDGIAFCKLIKENIDTSHIPFMMLTAKTALSSTIEGAASGADFYFGKPLSMELLQITIRNTLEQKRKSKERFLKDYYYEAKELVHSSKDKEFMDTLLTLIEAQLMNPDLDVSYLCSSMGMSKTNLYQKIKQLTGQSVGDFVRTIRLKKAIYIMTHEDVAISEVILRIGIQTQSYFTKAFKKEFGKTPSQFLQELRSS